jgi:hypothetical protein
VSNDGWNVLRYKLCNVERINATVHWKILVGSTELLRQEMDKRWLSAKIDYKNMHKSQNTPLSDVYKN